MFVHGILVQSCEQPGLTGMMCLLNLIQHYRLNEPNDVFEVPIIKSTHVSDEPSSIVS